MRKRILTALLTLALCISCFGLAGAVSKEKSERTAPPMLADAQPPMTKLELAASYADEMNALGLLKGTSQGYELETFPTRAQAVTMLLRLMGLEPFAQARPTPHPFTDLPQWCDRLVGYAYNSKLVNGISPNEFSPNAPVNARAYLTLLLRALGYGEADGLTWSNTYDFATGQALIAPGEYTDSSEFLRADLVILSYRALWRLPKGSQQPLLEHIAARPRFTTLPNGFVNTAALPDGYCGDSGGFAGQLVGSPWGTPIRPTWEGTETPAQLLEELNGFVTPNYSGLTFTPGGILEPGRVDGEIMYFVVDRPDRVGITVTAWRQGYASSIGLNQKLNVALEAFLYLTGDGEVAYALWSWLDASNTVPGGADTSAFGFVDVANTGHGGVIEMNGIQIEVDLSNPKAHTYWFTAPAA